MPAFRVVALFVVVFVTVGMGPVAPSVAQPADSAATGAEASLSARVESAFLDGNAEALLNPAADRVEISLFGARTYYSRPQALYVLRDFFKEYAPRRFELQNLTETGASYFVTGHYWHVRTDVPLRVYVRFAPTSDTADAAWRVHEVRVENGRR